LPVNGAGVYSCKVGNFPQDTFGITTPAELRQADQKALIVWERYIGDRHQGEDQPRGICARQDANLTRVGPGVSAGPKNPKHRSAMISIVNVQCRVTSSG
jgi:hypothetical protein